MRMMLLAALLAGCRSEQGWQGTSVGNPGDVTPKAARSTGVTHATGSLAVGTLDLIGCDGTTTDSLAIDAVVDIVGGELLELPGGTWCTLEIAADGLILAGTSDTSGYAYALTLDVQLLTLTSAAGVEVDGSRYLLELGTPDWLDTAALGLDSGDVEVSAGHPLYDTLLASVEQGSILYADDDEDGEVDDDERENPLAEDDDDDDSDDVGEDEEEETEDGR